MVPKVPVEDGMCGKRHVPASSKRPTLTPNISADIFTKAAAVSGALYPHAATDWQAFVDPRG